MKFSSSFLALAGISAAAADSYQCPGSAAWVYAWAEVDVTTTASCDVAKAEVKARVAGSQDGTWTDPHNGGTYNELSDSSYLELSRTTANGQYTDKMDLTFTDSGTGCHIAGCSESQVTSIADFSTNYCNMRMLYCGEADGCTPVNGDLGSDETNKKTSVGASSTASDCFPSTTAAHEHNFVESVFHAAHDEAEVARRALRGSN
eukprot:CAMPEP_0205922036 /NCGR_PEP_ID=MMETSP1325-20131115/13829_1 /ASSEMBLY_ACC=CAM_ASM_000708 /TAXON_ID=236786 /ORGANISM="Florenciella sp., Strain RCC1007" /LENGTH=203 /DNA_ID=CAMNT_0053289981 /DNA_START=68 /DNA_END=679 /DNA_ORIENTATION=+